MLAQRQHPCELVAIADPVLLQARAECLDLPLALSDYDPARAPRPQAAGSLTVMPVKCASTVPGELTPANADYVLQCLRHAAEGCLDHSFQALVTGPLHKGIINDAGHAFSGHTEYLAGITGGYPVMMLASGTLRVALATTHLPLARVPAAINHDLLTRVITVLDTDLRNHFGLSRPRILVCGLNPHAGEGGHLGREEIDIISPVINTLCARGIDLRGPLPADTAFTQGQLANADAVLAMYHDQGLPVLKHASFGKAVNITLGLPIIRTSVDHGTAIDLAGSGQADAGSLEAALALAADLSA